MSEIRVNTFKAEDGISAPSFPNGIQVTGIVTSTVLDNTVSGDLAVTGHLFIPDNKQLKIGNTSGSPDLKIYHNTTNTYIENSTGALRIGKSDNVRITDAADNTIIKSDGASAYLAYEGNDKLQSTNTGVTVTGTVSATSFSGDGSGLSGISVGITTEALVKTNGQTASLDLSKDDHKVTATGTVTIDVTGGTEADSHTLRIVNSGITTVGFSTYFLFPSGGTPSLPTASGAISLISFTVHRVGAVGVSTQLLSGASVNFS